MHKIRVAVLRGGPSTQFESSLKNGEVILRHLPDTYEPQDIFISQSGEWHRNGLVVTPHVVLSHADVVWNALQGVHDSNRKVHQLLELHQIPHTGPKSFASGITENPLLQKEILRREKIRLPQYIVMDTPPTDLPSEDVVVLWKTFSPPVYIIPVMQKKQSPQVVKTFKNFIETIESAFETADSVIVEEHIPGKMVSVGVIDEYRGSERYSLPVIDSSLTREEKEELEKLSRNIHDLLGLRHFSQTDFLVTPRRGIFVSDVVAHPNLHEESHFNKSLSSVGAPLSHFVNHVLELALWGK